jgi:hypothetical protein
VFTWKVSSAAGVIAIGVRDDEGGVASPLSRRARNILLVSSSKDSTPCNLSSIASILRSLQFVSQIFEHVRCSLLTIVRRSALFAVAPGVYLWKSCMISQQQHNLHRESFCRIVSFCIGICGLTISIYHNAPTLRERQWSH